MSAPARIFFDGRASCLEDVAGELSGESDISSLSSSAFRFLEAMAYGGTAKGSINLSRGSAAAWNSRFRSLIIRRKGAIAAREMEMVRNARPAYRMSVGFGRVRTGGKRSGVAAIKGRSLFAGQPAVSKEPPADNGNAGTSKRRVQNGRIEGL